MPDYIGTQALTGYPAQNKFPATTTPWGHYRVKEESTQLFLDTFDSALDTTNRWTASNAGGGVLPAYSTASVTLNSGITANGYSLLKTQPSWAPREPGFLEFAARINIEFPVSTNGYRFWGFANAAGTPTLSNPITDGVGFEILQDGKLYAVSYAANSRLVIADLSIATGNGAQPQNASAHKYYVFFRGDLTFWAIDYVDNIVALFTTGASGPNVNTLPATFLDIAGAGTTATTLILNGISVGDTGRNTSSVSDGSFPWRIQTVYPQASSYSAQVNAEGQRATFRYAVQAFTPVATPTAFLVIAGSATKVIRVKRIKVGGVATSNGNMQVQASRWSTAGTLGSAVLTALTAVKHDTNDVAATAAVSTVGTANYTTQGTGNAVPFAADRIFLATTATGATQQLIYDFSTRQDKPFILRGVTDILSLSGNGSAVPAGGVLDIEVETEEDTF